jgi:acyl-CoA synthetase (AMP-forming)/AMP-acid ligase II
MAALAANAASAYEWLFHHAGRRPDAPAVACWATRERSASWLTYAELLRATDEAAAGLRRMGISAGDRVVLVLPNDFSFVIVLLACIRSGVVAVPGPVPAVARTDALWERLDRIIDDCGPLLLVTDAPWEEQLTRGRVSRGTGCRIVTWQELQEAGAKTDMAESAGTAEIKPSGFTVLQYTSGSTSQPKGIIVTHQGFAASCAQARQLYAEDVRDVAVTWVPLYHDMGLVTGVMRPLFNGYPSVLLKPDDFARDPFCWLDAIAQCGGTLSSAPNFAFELCVRKVDTARVRSLNLGTWRVARNAGEMVRPETADRFIQHFSPAGFPAEGMCPSYGLAEATLAVTATSREVRPLRLAVHRSDLDAGRVRLAGAEAGDDIRWLLSSGMPVAGTRVQVSDRDSEDEIGEIAISGPQVSPGHWNGPLRQQADDWHCSGDVGFIHQGHLFVLGRIDDTLIYRGRNFYMSDLLAACAGIDGLRPGRLAVFPGPDDGSRLESVFVVAELRRGYEASAAHLASIRTNIKYTLARSVGLYVTSVRFLPAGMLPVTTSGKVRVSEARRRFLAGALPLLPEPTVPSKPTM